MIGINVRSTSTDLKSFVSHFGITFTMLRDRPPWVTDHYGIEYWSQFWLLDELRDRVGDNLTFFSVDRVEKLLAELERTTGTTDT